MRLRHALLAQAIAVFALVTVAAKSAAASPQARLVYGRAQGAEACPDETALRRAVAARIGYDPFFPTAPRTIVVTVVARGDHLMAHVQLVDDEAHAQGARELASSGRDCGALFDTVALTISIAIDPQSLARPTATPTPPIDPSPPPPLPPPPIPATTRDDVPADADTKSSAPRTAGPSAHLGAALRSSIGLAPGPAFGVAVSGGASWERASLGAEASVDLPAGKQVSSGESVTAWLLAGSLVPCLRFAPIEVCGLATVGRFDGSATGVLSPQSRAALFVAFGGRLGFEVPIAAHVAFGARADLLANLSRATLRVGAIDQWTASPVAGVLSLGVAASF